MSSTAISAQGSIVQIATGTSSGKTISGVTLGNPTIITATAHGFNNGDVVVITGITGTTVANGTWTVQFVTTNTFSIALNTTGGTAYVSGGSGTANTYTAIGNAKTFSGLDGQASEMDISNFASTGKEFLLGLYDGGQLQVDLDIDNSDAGQQAARTALQGSTKKAFKVILPAGTTPNVSFNAFVRKFTMTGGVDKPLAGQMVLRISGGYSLS